MLKHTDKKAPITFTSEGLAVPEVHVGHKDSEIVPEKPDGDVLYDTVAVPEFRPSHGKQEKKPEL